MSKIALVAAVFTVAVVSLASAASTPYSAVGVVQQADPASRTVTLAHQAVPSLNWPAMTMQFSVLEPALLDRLPAGREVAFEFVQQPNGWRIVNAIPLAQSTAASAPAAPDAGMRGGMHGGMADMSMRQMCMEMMGQMGSRNR